MLKTRTLALAAILALGTSGAALAQGTPETLAPGLDNTQVNDNEPIGADDYDDFITNFESADFTSAADVLDRANSVVVIKLSSLNDFDEGAFNTALDSRASDVALLQTRINANPKAMAAVQGAGVTAEDIVAIEAAGDGSVVLYARDSM